MATALYNKLGEDFNAHNGQLVSYTNSSLTPQASGKHYDIRSFHSTDVTVPQTMLDLSFWNAFHYTGDTMDELSQRRSIVGGSFRRHIQDEYSIAVGGQGAATYETQTQLDNTSQYNLDYASVSSGNEDWPTGDGTIVVGKDAAFRYANSIRVTLTSGVTKIVPSFYDDDILTDFNDGNNYFIELLLRSFPSQGAGAHLDLVNSYIDFSADQTFATATTDSIRFNQSLNSLSAGGDVAFRINRNLLTHVNLSQVGAIRFRLLATGGAVTFIAQAMRLIPTAWTSLPAEIDTKRGTLSRSVPPAGGAEGGTTNGLWLFQESRPEDVTVFAKLNTGHHPTATDNSLTLYARYVDVNNWLRVIFTSRDTGSRFIIEQKIAGVQSAVYTGSTGTNILLQEGDYYIVVDVKQGQVIATLYNVSGNFLGQQVYTTGLQTVGLIGRGRIGYDFVPYNYDFTLDFFNVTNADFVKFESTVFNSRTPVTSATLASTASKPANLIEGSVLVASGDASISSIGIGQPGPSTKIARDGTAWFGGLQQDFPGWLGDPSQVYVEGDIYPVATVRGLYRAALVDNNGSVGWLGYVSGMLPNQWNHFAIPVSYDMLPVGFRLYIHQAGFYPDTFYVDNISLNHLTISWEASANGGSTWQPFSTAINESFTGIKFLTPGTALKVRATANSDRAWLEGFQLVPHYQN